MVDSDKFEKLSREILDLLIDSKLHIMNVNIKTENDYDSFEYEFFNENTNGTYPIMKYETRFNK